MWRLVRTTRQPLRASTRDLRDTCGARYQSLRESLSAYTDDLVAILAPATDTTRSNHDRRKRQLPCRTATSHRPRRRRPHAFPQVPGANKPAESAMFTESLQLLLLLLLLLRRRQRRRAPGVLARSVPTRGPPAYEPTYERARPLAG